MLISVTARASATSVRGVRIEASSIAEASRGAGREAAGSCTLLQPGEVADMAVRALLHYALEVPDQTVGEKFYTAFGLVDESRRDGAVALRPAPLARQSVLLYGGPKKRLHHLAFGAPGDEFAATKDSIR